MSGPLGAEGGFLVLGHYRDYGDYDSPDGEVLNSGFEDSGVLLRAAHRAGPGMLTAAWQGDYARDIGQAAQQLADGPLLLPRGRLEPVHALL